MFSMSLPRLACVASALTLVVAGSAFSTSGTLASLNSNFDSATTATPLGPFTVIQAWVREPGGPLALGGAAAYSNSNAIMSFNALGSTHYYSTGQSDWSWAAPSGYFAANDIFYFTF